MWNGEEITAMHIIKTTMSMFQSRSQSDKILVNTLNHQSPVAANQRQRKSPNPKEKDQCQDHHHLHQRRSLRRKDESLQAVKNLLHPPAAQKNLEAQLHRRKRKRRRSKSSGHPPAQKVHQGVEAGPRALNMKQKPTEFQKAQNMM